MFSGKRRILSALCCLIVATLILGAGPLEAKKSMSSDVVANYFTKLLSVNKTWQKLESPSLLVVHGSEKRVVDAQSLRDTLVSRGPQTTLVSQGELSRDQILKSDVLINLGGKLDDQWDNVLVQQNILTLTLVPELVQNGHHSVGLAPPETSGTESIRGAGGSKPTVVYNLSRLQREGHSFPSRVMELGKVFK